MHKLLLIVILTLTATACSKDKKQCWGCVLLFNDGYVTSYRDSMICDKTQGEITDLKGTVFDATAMGYRTYQVNNCSKLR